MDCRAVIKENVFSLSTPKAHLQFSNEENKKISVFPFILFSFLVFLIVQVFTIFCYHLKKKDRIKWLPQGVHTFFLGYKQQKKNYYILQN